MMDLREPASRAILLGASSYDSAGLPDVPAVVDTVNDLRKALIERCGMARESISDLRDRHDANQVMAAVAREARHAEGILLIHYVGHGLTGRHGELYLSVRDTDPEPELGRREQTAIPYREIVRHLGESRALAIVVILDCCFSGRALPRSDAADHGLAMPAGRRGGGVITSAAREEHAIARAGATHTAFTGQLLALLTEGDSAGPELLTLRAACDYLDRTLEEDGLPRPQWMFTGAADNIVLTGNPAYEPRTKILPVPWSLLKAPGEQRPSSAPVVASPLLSAPPPDPPPPSANGSGMRRSSANRRALAAAGVAVLAAGLVAALLTVLPDTGASSTLRSTGRTSTVSTRPTLPPTPATSPVDCASGTLTLIGSTAFGEIAHTAASAYMSQCKNVKITVTYGNGIDSASGVSAVEKSAQSGQAGSMIAMYDGATTTLDKPKPLTSVPVGVVIFSMVAHVGMIPGSNISLAELGLLFTQPGGVAGKVAVGLQAGSATRQALLGIFGMQPGSVTVSDTKCPSPSGHAVSYPNCTAYSYTQAIGFVSGTPNAIGYVAVDGEDQGHPTGYPNVSVISINGAAPTPENVHEGSYYFVAAEHLYVSPQPSALAKSFLAYLPQYLARHQQPDFLACSRVPESLAAQCAT